MTDGPDPSGGGRGGHGSRRADGRAVPSTPFGLANGGLRAVFPSGPSRQARFLTAPGLGRLHLFGASRFWIATGHPPPHGQATQADLERAFHAPPRKLMVRPCLHPLRQYGHGAPQGTPHVDEAEGVAPGSAFLSVPGGSLSQPRTAATFCAPAPAATARLRPSRQASSAGITSGLMPGSGTAHLKSPIARTSPACPPSNFHVCRNVQDGLLQTVLPGGGGSPPAAGLYVKRTPSGDLPVFCRI